MPQLPSTTCTSAAGSADQSVEEFVRWAAAQLGLELAESGSETCVLRQHIESDSGEEIKCLFTFCWQDGNTTEAEVEVVTLHGPLVSWLTEQLQKSGPIVHVRPKEQPQSVHEFSQRLFAAYTVDGGGVHLGGCHLEDRPFLRLTYATAIGDAVEHFYFNSEGAAVEPAMQASLCLQQVVPAGEYPPRIPNQQVELLLDAGRRQVAEGSALNCEGEKSAAREDKPLAAALVWAKYVHGKMQFTVGEATADLPFEGWARTLTPPPFVCPSSSDKTYHVGATADERIVAAEELAFCAKSDRCVAKSDLVECSVTRQHVLEEFTVACPVSGQPALLEEFDSCNDCQQQVSRSVLSNGTCSACRELAAIHTDDPRLIWLLGEFPKLDSFRRWKLSETSTVYIMQASTLWKRFFIVVDKETIEVKRIARRGRISSAWVDMEPSERDDILSS